jgi:hypothetical protein
MSETSNETSETFDPRARRLCPDGSCVGLIGDDGHCRVCGRTEAEAASGQPAEAFGGEAEVAEVLGDFDSKRRLCDDGSCVGVVGDDGACRVCGRRAE